MKRPHADELIPLMPQIVKEEYFLRGDASLIGFGPLFKDWVKKSSHPMVIKFANDVRAYAVREIQAAHQRQAIMNEHASEFYGEQRGPIRNRAVIDPVLKAHTETIHGREVFKDPEAIKDTEKLQPKLFIKP